MARYKLLFAIDSLTGGGAERVMTQLANRLDRARFTVSIALTLREDIKYPVLDHVAVTALGGSQSDFRPHTRVGRTLENGLAHALALTLRPRPDAAGTLALRMHLRRFRGAIGGFGRHVRRDPPDAILSFLPNTNLIALAAQRWFRFDAPVLCADRNYLSREIQTLPWSGLHARATRLLYRGAARHIAVTDAAGEDLHRNFGVPRDAITTIGNGVDIESVQGRAQEGPPPVWTAPGVAIVAIGRLQQQKGFDVLLDALARIGRSGWHLTVLGGGPDEAALLEQARRLGLAERVRFVGWEANPYRWLAAADLFVLSSRWEGFPNVLLEAMALGRPVVATGCPSGPGEVLAAGRYGALVPPEDAGALAAAIGEFIADPDRRRRFGELAAERARDYTVERMVSAYERAMLQALERTGRRAQRVTAGEGA